MTLRHAPCFTGYMVGRAALFAMLMAVSVQAHAGKLSEANERIEASNELSSPVTQPSHGSSRHHRRSTASEDSQASAPSGGDPDFLATLCLATLPWCLPYLALEYCASDAEWAYARYPYAGGANSGYIHEPGRVRACHPAPKPAVEGSARLGGASKQAPVGEGRVAHTQSFSVRPSAEVSYVFDNLLRARAATRLLTPSRLELSGSVSAYAERIPETGGVEMAVLGRAGVDLRFAQSSKVQFRTGGSVLHWNYEGAAATGGALTYGIDFFLGRPVIGSAEAHLGVLGRGFAMYSELRGTLGVSLERTEVYVGYQLMHIDDVPFGGPLMGLRLWL